MAEGHQHIGGATCSLRTHGSLAMHPARGARTRHACSQSFSWGNTARIKETAWQKAISHAADTFT